MQDELRIYTVRPGAMTDWLQEWAQVIRPLRLKYGFKVLGAWVDAGQNQFIWILRHQGPGSYEADNAAYYESAERKAIDPDPARHLANTDYRWIDPVG